MPSKSFTTSMRRSSIRSWSFWPYRAKISLARAAQAASSHAKPRTIAPAAEVADVGMDAHASYAIFIDSVRHRNQVTSYAVQTTPTGLPWATREHYVVDCQRKLRAFEPDDSASGARLNTTHVAANSRESRELAAACAMPDGPRSR